MSIKEAEKPLEEQSMKLDELLAIDDIEYATVPIGSSGKFITIRSVTAEEWIIWQEANESGDAKRTAGIRLIIKSLVDGIPGKAGATGRLICRMDDLGEWKKKSFKLTETIVTAILKLNGKGDAATKKD
jgi:hypothetical protein